MLTVLIRYKKGERTDREVIMSAKSVEFVPKDSKYDTPGLLINHVTEAEGESYLSPSDNEDDWRDIFVMNADGQTVGHYIL